MQLVRQESGVAPVDEVGAGDRDASAEAALAAEQNVAHHLVGIADVAVDVVPDDLDQFEEIDGSLDLVVPEIR